MDDYEKRLARSLKDPEFAKLWEEDEIEYKIISMIIQARIDNNLSQKELSERTGIRQPNISRLESGKCMPDILTLAKIAEATGKRLEIAFK